MTFDKGSRYKGFIVTKNIEIDELKCRLIELTHEASGAEVIHIANDDPENVFCIAFRTTPDSSNGVAHILEHTVLCGSEKYPVKDPFFKMTRRSLNTFMNAFTGSDFTCYPAASEVPKDFYNLLDVYLDAAFFPKIEQYSFKQEGHRLEFSTADDPHSPLEFKGIVYNEMKGAMASPQSRLHEAVHKALFPDITYGVNSGGDPKVIPSLSYDGLKDFYAAHYHPSRSLFYFYGNMPLEGHLDLIAKRVLDNSDALAPLAPIPKQKRFSTPKTITENYPASDEEMDDGVYLSFAWLTCSVLEQEELLALCIIELVLMGTDASPLKHALLASGLCKTASAYIDPDMSEAPFVITLKGCEKEKADAIETLILSTLKSFCRDSIDDTLIESAMHQLEFHRSEITGDHGPFGLTLFMRSALLKQHGADPEDALLIHRLFEVIAEKKQKNPRYFVELIEKHLLNNTHRVRVALIPDRTLAQKENEEERNRLDAIAAKLSSEEKKALVQEANNLERFQKEQDEEDPDILPTMLLEDVPKVCQDYILQQTESGALNIYHHPVFTNGIVYSDLIWNLPALPEQDLPLLRLFSLFLAQVGCGTRSYMENLDFIQANTGGIGAALSLNLQADDCTRFIPSFHIRGKALYRKKEKLFQLLSEMALSPDFSDRRRIKDLLLKQYTALQSALTYNAMKYAITLSASGLTVPAKINNLWSGLGFFHYIKALAEDPEKGVDIITEKFRHFAKTVLCAGKAHLVLSCEQECYQSIEREKFYALSTLPMRDQSLWNGQYTVDSLNSQSRNIASPVAFTSKAMHTVPYTDPDAPALNIAANLFDNITLHRKIREIGGAYGGGASCNSLSGNFIFYAYRDPHIVHTVKAFQEAVETILKGSFNDADLREAKFEKIQQLDTPISPGSRGDVAFSWIQENRSKEKRQTFRDKLLSASKKEVITAVERHISKQFIHSSTVVFAGKELIDKENKLFEQEGASILPISTL